MPVARPFLSRVCARGNNQPHSCLLQSNKWFLYLKPEYVSMPVMATRDSGYRIEGEL